MTDRTVEPTHRRSARPSTPPSWSALSSISRKLAKLCLRSLPTPEFRGSISAGNADRGENPFWPPLLRTSSDWCGSSAKLRQCLRQISRKLPGRNTEEVFSSTTVSLHGHFALVVDWDAGRCRVAFSGPSLAREKTRGASDSGAACATVREIEQGSLP
jgi:hypothetical protein